MAPCWCGEAAATAAGADSSSSMMVFRGCFDLYFFENLRRERDQGRFGGGLVCWRERVDVREGGGSKEGEGVGEALERKEGDGEVRWRWRRRQRRAVSRVSRM